MISLQKLESLRRTNQSQPGRSHPRHINNINNDVADGDTAKRTGNGSVAHSRGSGQRDRNDRTARSDDGFPRPVTFCCSRHSSSSTSPDGGSEPSSSGALTAAGSIKLGFHVSRSDMHVTSGRVDMRMTKKSLHHGKINTGLG